jgi:murein DD-endopeptidase MepM/ murein hydrolase activator NlpD
MRQRKYFLDLNDLQYKQVRLPWARKFLHIFLWVAGSVAVTIVYSSLFENFFGSPKEAMLNQQIGSLKIQYALSGRELDNSLKTIKSLKMSDEIRYRPILTMDSIPETFRNPGFGGVDRFSDLDGYSNSALMKAIRIRIEELKNMANVQAESFVSIKDRSEEWKFEMDHLPSTSPVDPMYSLGDRYGYREHHPILGIGRMHYGQDFRVPYGTKVFATGDGIVASAGSNSGGFGNVVIIDHGNGLRSYYAHLSEICVSEGMNVKRGDKIGLSGDTGSSTGPHLHYQINKFGQPVNAINFFNNDVSEVEFKDMIEAFASKSKFR